MAFYGWFSFHGRVVSALIEPHVEALEWIIWVVLLPEAGLVYHKVCHRYSGVLTVEVAYESNCGDEIISREGVLEGVDLCVLQYLE